MALAARLLAVAVLVAGCGLVQDERVQIEPNVAPRMSPGDVDRRAILEILAMKNAGTLVIVDADGRVVGMGTGNRP